MAILTLSVSPVNLLSCSVLRLLPEATRSFPDVPSNRQLRPKGCSQSSLRKPVPSRFGQPRGLAWHEGYVGGRHLGQDHMGSLRGAEKRPSIERCRPIPLQEKTDGTGKGGNNWARLVCLVCMVIRNEPNKPDRPEKPDEPDRPHAECAVEAPSGIEPLHRNFAERPSPMRPLMI